MTSSAANDVWVCPGTFDPITNGHMDVVNRVAPRVRKLIVAVVADPGHKPKGLLNTAQRVDLAQRATRHLPNVTDIPFTGLLVNFASEHDATAIIRGLRNGNDFLYEFDIDQLNRTLNNSIETFYVLCDPKWSFCSSSAVRQLHHLGGDITGLVPVCVADALHRVRPDATLTQNAEADAAAHADNPVRAQRATGRPPRREKDVR